MLRALTASAIFLFANQCLALNRYHVDNMTPEEVTRLIQTEKKVILWYPSSNLAAGDLFGIFVSDAAGCGTGQTVSQTSISLGLDSVAALVCTDISSSPSNSGSQAATASAPASSGGAPAGGGGAPAGGGGAPAGGGGPPAGGGGMPL